MHGNEHPPRPPHLPPPSHPTKVVEVDEDGTCVSVRNAEQPAKAVKCAFDRVFGPGSGQQDIFMSLVPALDTVLKGFNACALAYGQTGSGKTHTLIGTYVVRGSLRGVLEY